MANFKCVMIPGVLICVSFGPQKRMIGCGNNVNMVVGSVGVGSLRHVINPRVPIKSAQLSFFMSLLAFMDLMLKTIEKGCIY